MTMKKWTALTNWLPFQLLHPSAPRQRKGKGTGRFRPAVDFLETRELPATLSGVVFDNTVENDGVFHSATDPGINGVLITLTGTDAEGNPVNRSTTTTTIGGQAGSYVFSGLPPTGEGGSYTITETGIGLPATFVDGKDSVPGSLGGQQANQYADAVTDIFVQANDNGVGYNFGEILGARVS